MRWWFRKPKPLPIPPFRPDIKPLEPKDPDYVVTETEMTQTGMWRIFPWTKKEPKE